MAEGSKNQTAGAIRQIFREAVKAIIGRDDEPPATRRRSGDKTGDGAAAVRPRFRRAVKAMTGRRIKALPSTGGEAPARAFGRAARIVRRAVSLPPEAFVAATDYLSDALDWLNLWENDAGDCGNDFDAECDYIAPDF